MPVARRQRLYESLQGRSEVGPLPTPRRCHSARQSSGGAVAGFADVSPVVTLPSRAEATYYVDRTRVRKYSTDSSTYLAELFDLTARPPTRQAYVQRVTLDLTLCKVTLQSASSCEGLCCNLRYPAHEQAGAELAGFRRRERNVRRSQLLRSRWIYEVTGPRYALHCFITHVETRSPPES